MIVIPEDKLIEWELEFERSAASKADSISRISYVAHCAAQWAYNQGMLDLQRLIDNNYH